VIPSVEVVLDTRAAPLPGFKYGRKQAQSRNCDSVIPTVGVQVGGPVRPAVEAHPTTSMHAQRAARCLTPLSSVERKLLGLALLAPFSSSDVLTYAADSGPCRRVEGSADYTEHTKHKAPPPWQGQVLDALPETRVTVHSGHMGTWVALSTCHFEPKGRQVDEHESIGIPL